MDCMQCEDTGSFWEICPDCSGNGCRWCKGVGELKFDCDCLDHEAIDLIDLEQ